MMDPIKVSGVRDWKVPTNTTENCTFQGFTNFYHHFIPNLSKFAKLLNDLLKTGVKWHWGEQQKAFEEIQRLIMSEPVLCQPDQTKPFEVKVDASNYAMGACNATARRSGTTCTTGFRTGKGKPGLGT